VTSDDVITELLGDGWDEEVLPYFLDFLRRAIKDADRYSFIRDFAKPLTFSNNARNRLEMKYFDDVLDAKQYDFNENN
jgi:hypothetical protein